MASRSKSGSSLLSQVPRAESARCMQAALRPVVPELLRLGAQSIFLWASRPAPPPTCPSCPTCPQAPPCPDCHHPACPGCPGSPPPASQLPALWLLIVVLVLGILVGVSLGLAGRPWRQIAVSGPVVSPTGTVTTGPARIQGASAPPPAIEAGAALQPEQALGSADGGTGQAGMGLRVVRGRRSATLAPEVGAGQGGVVG